ncbi:MAG TPA: glutathione transferase GstA [Candidatus Kapabacteria bacterium]|nr:glutathione transferase GstA [Candidatus Kapabacteria bacterium]
MKLYYSPGACSLSPHIVALEADLPLQLEKTDLAKKTTASGEDFLKVNAKGYVPALKLDDGSVLTEGPAIVQYLADKAPASKLIPAAGTLERYRVLEWLNFISTELHKTFSPLFNPTTTDARKQEVREYLAKRFTTVEQQLAKTPFITGDSFTVADAYLFTVLGWGKYVNVELPKPLQDYLGRVFQRPAVQQALKEEGLI